MEQLATRLSEIHIGDALDVGTGQGASAQFLVDSCAGFDRIIGIDVVPEALQTARANFQDKRVKFLEMPAEALAFARHEFDTVAMTNALHHLNDPKKALKEMSRVLKPGGCLILTELHATAPSPQQVTQMLYHHLNAEIDTILGKSHHPTFEKAQILRLVKSTGLEITDQFECSEPERERDQDELDTIAAALDQNVENLQGMPEYAEIKKRADEVKARLYEVGFARPNVLVVFGVKT